MTIFQFLLIVGVLIAALLAIRFLPGDRSLAIKRLFAILFAVAAVLAILFPTVLTSIANFLGIGRGADLLLYVSVLAMLLFAVAAVRSKARADARVTDLARSVALMEARLREHRVLPEGPPPEAPEQPADAPEHPNPNEKGGESA